MASIYEIVDELKTRRDWHSPEEVERKFDEIIVEFDRHQAEELIRHKKFDRDLKNDIIGKMEEYRDNHIDSTFQDKTSPGANEVRKAYNRCITIIEGAL